MGSFFHAHPHLLSFSKKKKKKVTKLPVQSDVCCPCSWSLQHLLGGFFSWLVQGAGAG